MQPSLEFRLVRQFSSRSKLAEILLASRLYEEKTRIHFKANNLKDAIRLGRQSHHLALRLYILGYQKGTVTISFKSVKIAEFDIEITCRARMLNKIRELLKD